MAYYTRVRISLELPSSLVKISDYAFFGCLDLRKRFTNKKGLLCQNI